MSKTRKLITPFCLIPSLLILGLLALVIGLFIWIYIDRLGFPLEPETSGVIPEKPEWIFQASEKVISSPVFSDSKIYIRTCCSIYALDSNTGKLLWRVDSNAPYGVREGELTIPPLIYEDSLIVPEKGSNIAAYSTTTGQLQWVTPELVMDPGARDLSSVQSYVIREDKLFVARYDWMLSAYDLLTGQTLWEVPVEGRASLDVEAGSQCIYISEGEILRCHQPGNGNILWEKKFVSFIGPISLDEKTLYASLFPGPILFIAIDLQSLETKWVIQQDTIPDNRLTRLLIAGDRLYGTGKRLYAISSTDGSIIWSSEEAGLLEQPLSSNGYIVVRNQDKDLFVLTPSNGQVIGHMKVKANSASLFGPDRGPVIAGSLLIVPFGNNRVFAYLLK